MSTVRLVSVVVPDWLTATIKVSLMSGRSRKPESSVARTASTSISPLGVRASRPAASACPATAAVPCPIASTRVMVPLRTSSRISSGMTEGPSETRKPASVSTILPRSVLRKEVGDSPISFIR